MVLQLHRYSNGNEAQAAFILPYLTPEVMWQVLGGREMATGQWELLKSPSQGLSASHMAVSYSPSVVPAAKLKPIAAGQVMPARV